MTIPSAKQVIDFELATSYRRVIARLIDLGVGFFVFLLFTGVIAGLISSLFKVDESLFGTLSLVTFFLLLVAYDTIMHRLLGKTVGKLILGLRVVDLNGEKLSWGMCILRAFLTYLVVLGVVFLTFATATIVGWIFMGSLGKFKRFPQDSATRSFVVREIKGQLVKTNATAQAQGGKPTPQGDLDRLFQQGMITKEELDRKKEELGVH